RINSALYDLSCLSRGQAFGGVIRLLRPVCVGLLHEFDTTPVHDVQLAVSCAQDNEGRPPGVSLQPKGYSHGATSSPQHSSLPGCPVGGSVSEVPALSKT